MTGLAALLHWSGEPFAPSQLDAVVDSLGARSGPSFELEGTGLLALAASSPRSAFEISVAVDSASGLVLALVGRLDEPVAIASANSVDERTAAPAARLLTSFLAVGDRVFDRLVGPFAVLVVDPRGRRATLARDPLGGRSLYLRRMGERWAIASRPSALARLEPAATGFDERALAAFLAIGGPPAGATFFRDVEELPPGAVLTIEADGRRSSRRIELAPEARPGAGRDTDYEERFRELLDVAVACRLAPTGRTGVLTSGGRDSTSVVASAALRLARDGREPPIALSWVFDELAGIDERPWIEATLRATGAVGIPIVADGLGPLRDSEPWPVAIDAPLSSPFARPRRTALAAAREAGCDVLLTGEAADDLWWASPEWLRSLLVSGRWLRAGVEVSRLVALASRRRVPWTALRHALARLRRPHGYLPQRSAWPWLTPRALSLVEAATGDAAFDPVWGPFARPAHPLTFALDQLFLRVAEDEAAAHGVEYRRPYRDRRLVEFMLSVPPRLLYRPGERKLLLRRALSGRLPADVLCRSARTTLLPLYRSGFEGPGATTIRRLLDAPDAVWPEYVRPEWLRDAGWRAVAVDDGAEALVLWHCVTLELWRRVWRSPLAPDAHPR